jgi:hypothetical protein
VLGPAGLLLPRPRRVPLRAGAVEYDEERRHGRILSYGGARAGAQALRTGVAGSESKRLWLGRTVRSFGVEGVRCRGFGPSRNYRRDADDA